MSYEEIYHAAQSLVGESAEVTSEDYEARAPYLLGSFVTEQIPLQKRIDAAAGTTPVEYTPSLCVTMSDDFPLSPLFLTPAAYYLAAMLVLDENEDLSDRLFDRYVDGIAGIAASIATKSETIKDCYHALD